MTATRIIATIGKNIENTAIIIDIPVSNEDTTGFAKPPVVAVDVILVTPVVLAIEAAVPPPAIMAKAQVITGLKSVTVETITAVPATAAKGIAIESSKLSK